MLQITDTQYQVLAADAFERTLDQWTAEFAVLYPQAVGDLTPTELRARLGQGARQAAEWGIEDIANVRQYLIALLHLGSQPDGRFLEPALNDLCSGATPEREKMDRLGEWLEAAESDDDDEDDSAFAAADGGD